MDTFTYYIGEGLYLGAVLKDNGTQVAGKTLKARFIRCNGPIEKELGEEQFTDAGSGTYTLSVDTTKYNGPLRVRLYVVEDDEYLVVGEDCLYITGNKL